MTMTTKPSHMRKSTIEARIDSTATSGVLNDWIRSLLLKRGCTASSFQANVRRRVGLAKPYDLVAQQQHTGLRNVLKPTRPNDNQVIIRQVQRRRDNGRSP